MLMWIIGLILPPCQRLLFCRLAHSASLPRRAIQLLTAQHSVTLGKVHGAVTWPHPSATHLSPVLRWKNTAATNTKWGEEVRACQMALTLISQWSQVVNKILFHKVWQQWRWCDKSCVSSPCIILECQETVKEMYSVRAILEISYNCTCIAPFNSSDHSKLFHTTYRIDPFICTFIHWWPACHLLLS